ncbi:hypothetical protein [Taibaiella helva]|uniref:hypothetical protein n=1 Tax=Taibaiella helva TaxID=2301235 RepID=UPI000E586C81|nr:hypothetical protein [Taibaiella helva]
MQNTFSRSFRLNATTEKKFYFVPVKSKDVLSYNVHINSDVEVKKFDLDMVDGKWGIRAQQKKLPEWVFELQPQFHEEIQKALQGQER